MKLTVIKKPELEEDLVHIQYSELTPQLSQILQICEDGNSVFICEKDGTNHKIDLHDVLYIEWVDNKCCVYTKDDIFTISLSLVKLEESLGKLHFIRISKNCLCNLFKVKSISNGLNMQLTVEMTNNERVIVSRHYRGGLLKAIHSLSRRISK